jgi:hypothetical protein
MPTSVTSMNHCDHSMHIIDLKRGIREHMCSSLTRKDPSYTAQ